ncbi:hypothetical protein HHJ52_24400 (plasmid) [Escherichia coli]|nr:hypothetical protein HHJ52_24400 [Escherichia coli]
MQVKVQKKTYMEIHYQPDLKQMRGVTLVSGIPLKFDSILKLISDATGIPIVKSKAADLTSQNATSTISAENVSQKSKQGSW